MASCVWPCAWSCALWPVGESTSESFSAKMGPCWLKRAVIRHTPRRENLIYALLVAVVVRGIRAALWAILLLRRMSMVVRLVRVVVRRVRAGLLRRVRVVVRLVACEQINQ